MTALNALSVETLWPELADTIGLTDLALACAMSSVDLQELVEFGALLPMETSAEEPVFATACMESLRAAGKIRSDYDLDLFVVVIVMDFMSRIENLEAQLRQCHCDAAHKR